MTTEDRSPTDRDRRLRRGRVLSVTVVSAGIVGSLGVAGAVALAETGPTTSTAVSGRPDGAVGTPRPDDEPGSDDAPGSDDSDSFSTWRTEQDGGSAQPAAPAPGASSGEQTPDLQRGSSPFHGNSGGS